jgi:hypothetical protein
MIRLSRESLQHILNKDIPRITHFEEDRDKLQNEVETLLKKLEGIENQNSNIISKELVNILYEAYQLRQSAGELLTGQMEYEMHLDDMADMYV